MLAACGGTASAPAQSAQASQPAQAAAKLVVGYSNIAGDEIPLWLAKDAGIFDGNGLNVDLQYLAGGTKAIAALVAGDLQVSSQGGGELMGAVSGGADLVAIANLGPVYPFELEVTPDIKATADLKGKKVGVASIGGASDIAARVVLRKNGLDPDKDVSIIAVGDARTAKSALQSGAIQGTVLSPPSTVEVEAGGAHPLYNLAALKLPNTQGLITLQRSWLNANRATAQKLVDALVQATARTKHDPAAAKDVIRKYYKLDDAKAVDATYDFYTQEVYADYPYPRADQFTDALSELSKKSEQLKGFDPNKIIDDSLVKSAEQRAVASK